MNFFQSIVALQVAGDWRINIARETGDTFAVSVLFYNDQIGDDARKKIPPLLLRGTAEELDSGFIQAIEEPVKKTASLLGNMEQFMKQLELAKITSQMEKDKADKLKKENGDKQKKYEEAMKKVDELEAAGKHRDAWVKVPDPAVYPEHADTIKDRKSALAKLFAPDLFNDNTKKD